MQSAGSGGDVPVDAADVVAGLVETNLGELQPLTAKGRAVVPAKGAGQLAPGGDLKAVQDGADGRRQGQGGTLPGQGAGTASKRRCRMASSYNFV